VRLSRCEVRDHINYRKIDRWRSYRFYRALQRLESLTCDICEIFGALRFLSFSTQSARSSRSMDASAKRSHRVIMHLGDLRLSECEQFSTVFRSAWA
jgi:hypothetical protein